MAVDPLDIRPGELLRTVQDRAGAPYHRIETVAAGSGMATILSSTTGKRRRVSFDQICVRMRCLTTAERLEAEEEFARVDAQTRRGVGGYLQKPHRRLV